MKNYSQLPDVPENISATNIIIRFIDGISFRFFHATEDLVEKDHNYKPANDCMTLTELLHHIKRLCFWVHNSFLEKPMSLDFELSDFNEMRASILNKLEDIQHSLKSMQDSELSTISIRDYPFWNMLNGPLADILTHVGQINTYRRLNKNPRKNPPSPLTGK